ARVVAEEDAFQRAWEDGRAESWRAFLDAHPDSPHGGRAREHLAEATQFESATTDAAVRKFLAAWPAGRHHLEAEIRLARAKEDAAFAIVTITRDPNEVAAFLAQYPDSPRRAEALALQAELRRELEPRDFSAAWENGTAAAWDDFFAEHPDSVRLEEARLCRQEAQDFELAVTTNTPVMWRAFLKTWPEGRHRIDAALRLRAMK
ncbi:MAG TPA: hypothetical protein VJZ00_07345, partial [Thermoanaerobaculia bacterium]|nr:hypothetical protein [Thermoanaerobaculia bacterium]